MSGCYGNSKEDRYFSAMLDRHLDKETEECSCEIKYDDNDNIVVDGVITTKEDIENNNNYCPECGEEFNIEEWFLN